VLVHPCQDSLPAVAFRSVLFVTPIKLYRRTIKLLQQRLAINMARLLHLAAYSTCNLALALFGAIAGAPNGQSVGNVNCDNRATVKPFCVETDL